MDKLNKNNFTDKINDLSTQADSYISEAENKAVDLVIKAEEKGLELIQNAEDIAHEMLDKGTKKVNDTINKTNLNTQHNYTSNENCCNCNREISFNCVKEYAIQHPILTTTAISATLLTGASLISPTTRKITKPVAKYALKQQGKLVLGIGMMAMATYVSNKIIAHDNYIQ